MSEVQQQGEEGSYDWSQQPGNQTAESGQAENQKDSEFTQEFDDEDDDDEDDDEIQVTIGDIKPTATFDLSKAAAQRANAQKAAAATGQPSSTTQPNTNSQQSGNKIDLDAPAFIGNVPVFEYNVDSVADEDKPWRKPGADITDYFNYGFNEDTWRVYCDRQRTLRSLFGDGQPNMKMLAAGRLPPMGAANMPRSIPSVVPTNMGDSDEIIGGTAGGSPRQGDDSFQQPRVPKQTSSISVIGTLGGARKPDGGQTSTGQAQGQSGSQNLPFGFPPFAFPGGAPFRPTGQFNAPFGSNQGGASNNNGAPNQDFSQPPPPRFFNPANPAMLAAAMSRMPLNIPPGSNQTPADLMRVLQSNPALASQIINLAGNRPPFPGGSTTLGNVVDDKPGKTPSPRGGSTPASSPEREDEPAPVPAPPRRRSRSPSRRHSSHYDESGGRRIGVLGGSGSSRRDYGDRRGGDSWDRGRRDDRDRRDRSPDRRDRRDRSPDRRRRDDRSRRD